VIFWIFVCKLSDFCDSSSNRGASAAENHLLRTLQVGYTEMQNDHRNAK